MWPFRKKQQEPEEPDTRPPSEAALAIAASLAGEPARWGWGTDTTQLQHDSGIRINVEDLYINAPFLDGKHEPEADADVLLKGINAWVAARLKVPLPPPAPEATP